MSKFVSIVFCFLILSIGISSQERINYLAETFVEYKKVTDSEYYSEIIIFDNYIVFTLLHKSNSGTLFVDGFNVYSRYASYSPEEHFVFLEPIFSTNRDLKDPFAPWFAGIYQHKLFIDYGTAPGIRGIDIWNLRESKIEFSGSYYGSIEFKDQDSIYVNDRIAEMVVFNEHKDIYEKNKKEIEKLLDMGLGYSFITESILNLNDYSIAKTNEILLIPEQ